MSDDSSAASSLSLSKPNTRGRLLALLGAGGGAIVASLFSRNGAQAGHDGTNVMHLGESNQVPAGALTALAMDVNNLPALQIRNLNSGTFSSTMRVMGSGTTPVITVESDAVVAGGPGFVAAIRGVSSGPGFGEAGQFGEGNGIGVAGTSRSGPGVSGDSREGAGVDGHSDTGPGAVFSSNSGPGLIVNGKAAIFAGSSEDFALTAEGENSGEANGGILGVSRGGKPAIEGDAIPSESNPGVGVQGVSGFDETFGQGPGVGVQGISGTGIGVEAICADGIALNVAGKAMFSTAGAGLIPAGQNSAFVPNPAVTGDSHITVTLVGDPGSRQVRWVERDPGSGFTVHLSSAPPPGRPQTPLTYLVVEPG